MPGFDVIILGTGDSFSEFRHPTSLLLDCDGFRLAIDCPDMYRRVLRDASRICGRALPLQRIDHLLLTHVHGDHMNGLEGVGFFKRFAENKRLTLHAAPEVLDGLWENRLKAPMGRLWDGADYRELGFADYFDARPLSWEDESEIGPFRIRIRRTIHHVPTTALFVTAGGRSLGYSCDTAFDPDLIDWLAPADLIIHETNFGPAHTAIERLLALPESLTAKMRLVHYADGFDVPGIRPALDGEILTP